MSQNTHTVPALSFRKVQAPLLRGFAALLVVSLFTVACGGGGSVGKDGDLVGGACASEGDCAEKCLTGGDFAGGICTQTCEETSECPDGTVCSEFSGGTCFLLCDSDADCRDGWVCGEIDQQGSESKAQVCKND